MAMNPQTLMPTVVTPNSQKIVTDINGDKINELIILDGDLKQLSIVYQFKYSDFTLSGISPSVWPPSTPGTTTPIWNDTTPRWMTVWAAQQGLVPASQGSGGWGIEPGDAISAADLDGDGIDELFIYNLTTSWWGVLKWQSNQLQTIYQVQVQPQRLIPVGQLAWRASAGDQYCIIPNLQGIIPAVNGAGILAYNFETQALGMMSYSAGKFSQWWNHQGSSLNGWNLMATSPPVNQFYTANFASSTAPSVVVYNPLDANIALLQWNGSDFPAFPAQQHSVGGWSLGSTDQIQCADLDGDDIAEILIYNPDTHYLGVLKWDTGQSQFQAPAVTSQITGPFVWNIGGNDKYFCLNGSGGKPGQIYAYSSDSSKVALLNYNGNFSCEWSGQFLLPNNGWPVNANDTYYGAAPSDSASPTLFALSNQGSALTLGAIIWNGTELTVGSSATLPVQAWSPAFVANAPATTFTPFTGNQLAIYQYISTLFPDPEQPNPSNIDARSCYTNAADKGKFQTYAFALEQLQNTNPSWSANWNAVVGTISAECNAVDTVYNMYDAISNLAAALNTFQTSDLTTVKLNIQTLAQHPPESAVGYWFGQVGVAAIWGLAAAGGLIFPEAAAAAAGFGVAMSMVASMAGSAAGYNPTQQKSYAFEDIEQEINNLFSQTYVSQGLDLSSYLGDPVKLNILIGLSQNEWALSVSLLNTAKAPFSAMDHVWMYQLLMPFFFSIQVWSTEPDVPPLYTLYSYSYYLSASGGISVAQFQTSDLYKDLFTTIGVPIENFFLGVGDWTAIPRTFVQ